jgi:hypothetical protein
MTSRKMRILGALAAAGMLGGPATASAWVAVRAGPRFVGAAAVGVAAGAVAGAAVASTAYPTYPSTVVVPPPPAAAPPPAPAAPAAGTVVTTLPSGCVSSGGRYQCGSVWYQPYFGANGVYYEVVR